MGLSVCQCLCVCESIATVAGSPLRQGADAGCTGEVSFVWVCVGLSVCASVGVCVSVCVCQFLCDVCNHWYSYRAATQAGSICGLHR
jgi:hypothetical protein